MMKLTALLILLVCLHAGAAVFSQKITLSVKGAPLEKIFQEIEKQSGYYFSYPAPAIKQAKPVSVQVKDATIEEVLQRCLHGQNLAYTIEGKIISVKVKGEDPVKKIMEEILPAEKITGVVKDENKIPLSGVSVLVKGTTVGTTTDASGRFTINAEKGQVLILSYIGYRIVEIKIGDQTFFDLQLQVVETAMQEVMVNKGYYTESKRLSTGSVASVTAVDIEKQPITNPLSAMQGRVSGVQITQSTGVPGSGFTVRIRGQNSLRTTFGYENDPLYIVDGVPYTSQTLSAGPTSTQITPNTSPLNHINPQDIKSIEVLKDADATSIYGSRGANGVILIRTKRGTKGKIKTAVNLRSGNTAVAKFMKLLNTDQYLEMRKEAYRNDGATPSGSTARDLLVWDQNRYTDWQKQLIGGTGNFFDAQLSLSGGTENTQYLISTNYSKESTVFPKEFDFYNRKSSTHLNLSTSTPDQRFKAIILLNYVLNKNTLPRFDPTMYALTLSPNAPEIYDSNGNLNWGPSNGQFTNPYSYFLQKYLANTNNLIANGNISYSFLKYLKIGMNLGYNYLSTKEIATTPKSTIHPANQGILLPSSYFNDTYLNSWIVEPQIEFLKKSSFGSLSVLIGGTFNQEIRASQPIKATGFSNDVSMDNIGAATSTVVENPSYSQYRYNALFGRINYTLKDKYILNITGRRDGSTRFGSGKQFANFGAVGAAWIFTDERMIADGIKFLTFGKLRTSYGTTGSDRIGDYEYLDSYGYAIYSYQDVKGLNPSRLFNNDYAWESNRKFDLALDLSFFADRIFISANYFNNRSSNQLIGYPLPITTGFSSIQKNMPAVVENKGWELELNTINTKSKLRWETNFNISFPKSRLISYPNLDASGFATVYAEGWPLTVKYMYEYEGVDPQTGLYQFKDIQNGGLTTNPIFNVDNKLLVDVAQKFYGGITNRFSYRNLALDFLFQFVKQNGRNYLNYQAPGFGIPGRLGNQPTYVLERWQKPGDITNVQKYSSVNLPAYVPMQRSGENVISDASFIRLKNISLAFDLSHLLRDKFKIENARIFAQGQNLFTVSNFKGLDPENQSLINLPPLKTICFGINVSL